MKGITPDQNKNFVIFNIDLFQEKCGYLLWHIVKKKNFCYIFSVAFKQFALGLVFLENLSKMWWRIGVRDKIFFKVENKYFIISVKFWLNADALLISINLNAHEYERVLKCRGWLDFQCVPKQFHPFSTFVP